MGLGLGNKKECIADGGNSLDVEEGKPDTDVNVTDGAVDATF